MRCEVLGALRVEASDGTELIPSGQAQRRLIAVLCLHANRPVSPSNLEEWLGISPGAVRTAISRLRSLVEPDALLTGSGYELRTTLDSVDFEIATSDARVATPEHALDRILRAVAMWRGPAFGEFTAEPWAAVEAHRLAELRATAIEDAAALLIGRGHHGRARALLEPLVVEHPYRDRPRALLMLAFASDGCQTEALRCFQDYRQLLLDEVGTGPSAELIRLDRSISAGDPAVSPWLDRSIPADRSPTAAPIVLDRQRIRNLPVPLTPFVGRSAEVDAVLALCRTHRLVTLTGPGGIGKTRLAIRACEALREIRPTAAAWVELGSVTDASEVPECVARAVGLPGWIDPITETVRQICGLDEFLLVLDNAEHLVDAIADLVPDVLSRCPSLQILVTSRRALGRQGEAVFRVPPLSHPDDPSQRTRPSSRFDAIDLFVNRANAVHGTLRLDLEALDHIATICRMLDGLPLAIELAAARTRILPLGDVARAVADVDRWPDLPTGSTIPRQSSLNASIRWSLRLIDDDDRRLLSCLAVFRTAFDLDAARAVAPEITPPGSLEASLGRLVDMSLLRLGEVNDRYDMLQSVRHFLETHDADGAIEAARGRHASYYAQWCRSVGNGERGIEHGPFIAEMPEVTAAAQWARRHEPDLALDICIGLAPIRVTLGYHADLFAAWAWLLDFEPDQRSTPKWAIAVASLLSWATTHRLDTSPIGEDFEARLPPDDARARGWLERGRAMVPAYAGNLGPTLGYIEHVHARHDDLEESVYGGFAAYMLALAGRVEESERHLSHLRRLTRRHGTVFSVDSVGNGYAATIVNDIVTGDLATAARRGMRPAPRDAAFAMTSAAALAEVGFLMHDRPTLERALAWSRRGTIPLLDFLPILIAGLDAAFRGEVQLAADLAEEFAERARRVPLSFVHSWPLMNRALLAAGRDAEARTLTADAMALVAPMDPSPYLEASILLGRAQIQDYDHDPELPRTAHCLLDLARTHRFRLRAIDARELRATDGPGLDAEREQLDYRQRMTR